jgi:DNA processing protein
MSRPEDPDDPAGRPWACPDCLRRSWLLGRLSGHLDVERGRILDLLELADEDLIPAVAGKEQTAVARDRAMFDAELYRTRCAVAGLELICRCSPAYPAALRSLMAVPAVLHVAGGMTRFQELVGRQPVAIVGARRASPYALGAAHTLARGIAVAGLTVISGMATGVDTAAHAGALDAGGGTIAVLACAPERPYPRAGRSLHRRILATGASVSELGVGVPVRRWMFPARNRIIAALGSMTVVAAARQGSGAMLTALVAGQLGRALGAVPGQVTAPLSWGPHQLLRGGARLVAEPGDVLDLLCGADRHTPAVSDRSVPEPRLKPLFDALADGYDLPEAFDEAGLDAGGGLAMLAALELAGHVRRQPGGRFSIIQ